MPQLVFYRAVKVDGLSIVYRESGPKDAPTILLLHGLTSSSRMFEPLLARLSDRYRLVAPDYPSFARNDWPGPEAISVHIRSLRRDHKSPYGSSRALPLHAKMLDYGGPVGFRLALAHPDRIGSLIVQDGVAR